MTVTMDQLFTLVVAQLHVQRSMGKKTQFGAGVPSMLAMARDHYMVEEYPPERINEDLLHLAASIFGPRVDSSRHLSVPLRQPFVNVVREFDKIKGSNEDLTKYFFQIYPFLPSPREFVFFSPSRELMKTDRALLRILKEEETAETTLFLCTDPVTFEKSLSSLSAKQRRLLTILFSNPNSYALQLENQALISWTQIIEEWALTSPENQMIWLLLKTTLIGYTILFQRNGTRSLSRLHSVNTGPILEEEPPTSPLSHKPPRLDLSRISGQTEEKMRITFREGSPPQDSTSSSPQLTAMPKKTSLRERSISATGASSMTRKVSYPLQRPGLTHTLTQLPLKDFVIDRRWALFEKVLTCKTSKKLQKQLTTQMRVEGLDLKTVITILLNPKRPLIGNLLSSFKLYQDIYRYPNLEREEAGRLLGMIFY